jgi:hypothetical protein
MTENVLSWIDIVAERRIVDAMNEGVFDNLPGKGKPLQLDDDLSVPPHLRIQAKILKNAGGVPEWIQAEKDWLREREYIDVIKQQGLHSLALCGTRDAALRRMIKLYEQTKAQVGLINTLLLKYNECTPQMTRKAFRPLKTKSVLAELEHDMLMTTSHFAGIREAWEASKT